MRKVLISVAAAASALAFASPAAAQWYPPQPQGYGYGYNNHYHHVRNLQVRLDRAQRHIHQLDRRNVLSNREAARLWEQSREIERRLHFAAGNGLHPHEANNIEARIARLEQRIFRDARDGRNWGRYGYNDNDGWDRRDDRRWRDRDDD
ncbi:MAG: hypothetical protein M3177_08370 [Pseudomonadota bacterium]|nr:hypothetical protein [Pseudomonadota bacterium]